MTTIVLESRVISVKEGFDWIMDCLTNERPYLLLTEVVTYYPPEYGFSGKPKEVTETKILINSRYIIEVKDD
jgi:hypothetical protein